MENFQEKDNTQDTQAVKNAIQNAYTDCSPEEQQQLKQLEQHFKNKNYLS